MRGHAIDIGSGPDPLRPEHWPNLAQVTPFDQEHGDANNIGAYFPPESFDLVHASQCLEHMHHPKMAFCQWLTLVKHGGAMVITVPAYELYECIGDDGVSLFNGDHKSTWSLWMRDAPTPLQHIHVPTMLAYPGCFPLSIERYTCTATLQDTGYNHLIGTTRDQTLHDDAEAFIEIIIRRKD